MPVPPYQPASRRLHGRRRWSAMNAFALDRGDRRGLGRWRSRRFRCRYLGFGLGVGLGLRFRFGLFGRKMPIDFSSFSGMDFVVGLVRFGQLMLVEDQTAESVCMAQLELGVHFDGVERTDLDANLAAHANGDIDVEHRRVKLRFTQV